jgi:thioredoxin 1
MIAPAYDDISKEYDKVVCLKIDVDEVPDIAERYQVMAMPKFLFLRGKKVVERFSGASIEKLRATIDQLA